MSTHHLVTARSWEIMEGRPIVKTRNGVVRGTRRLSVFGETYYSFERIPFAKPPVGKLRFRSPTPPSDWYGVLDCTDEGDGPLQKNPLTNEIEGSEDCLYLNIYVKMFSPKKRLPCLSFIYGGHFRTGNANSKFLGPDYFMHEDLVLMTSNYRVDVLGFLTLADPELDVPGNAGLKDQLQALAWFNENCEVFNGDPRNITLLGIGAGAVSAHFFTLCVAAKGLFHKSIFMSGTVFNDWAIIPRSDYAYRLAKKTGYTGDDNDKEILKHFMLLDGSKLVGHDVRTEEECVNGIDGCFGPTIEPYVDDDCFIRESPLITSKTAWGNHIPTMIGGCSFQGIAFVEDFPLTREMLKENPALLVPLSVRKILTPDECTKIRDKLIKEYFGNTEFHNYCLKLCEFLSLKDFWAGIHFYILSRLSLGSQPTYLFRFDFDKTVYKQHRVSSGQEARGVFDDALTAYLFRASDTPLMIEKSAEYQTMRQLIGMIAAFAQKSDPNCREIKEVKWNPLSPEQLNICLNIGKKLEIIELPEASHFPTWVQMYRKRQSFLEEVEEQQSLRHYNQDE